MSINTLRRFQLPYAPDPSALIADAGPDIPGGLGANKGYWMKQLRNPHSGQWVKMGHLVEFHVKLKDGTVVKEFGTFEGSDGSNARVRVEGGKHLPNGYYHPSSENVNPRAQALLTDKQLEKSGVDVEDTIDPKMAKYAQSIDDLAPDENLQDKADAGTKSKLVSGDAALANIRAASAKQAKAEGRFPVMRNGKDAERAAETQYKSIFEAFKTQNPEFKDTFKNADEYWDYVQSHAVDVSQNWAEDHTKIDPIMRASNKTYAQEILGVEPDGMIEFYRNAVNHKGSPAESAAGYISLDRRMAWDYNSKKTDYTNEHDGRYIVRVKPDEVTGALGYSKAEDEFGVVVGPDITSMPGRVERVGDLEIQTVTPYIDDTKTFDRSGGGSPFRHFSTASQFNFHTTDSEVLPGEKWGDFLDANKLDSKAISAKYDELHGEGSYEKARSQFGTPAYSQFKDFFVKTPDGEYGLDPRKLDAVRYQSGDSDAAGRYDHYLKILSSVQELDGRPFMVSNAHPLDDPRLAQVNKPKPSVPSPAMMPKKKAPAPEKPKALDFPSETRAKPAQKIVTALDGNSQPIKKGDTVHFQLERDGKSFKVEGEYLGVSLGSLSGKDDANKPFIRIKGQDGIKDGDYPIRSDVLNLAPGDSNFRDTRTPLASKLEAENHVPDATRLTQVTKEEYDALFAYTTENAFDDIRSLMEAHPGKTLDDIKKVATSKQDQDTLNQIKLIEDAIYNSPLAEDKQLFRGIEFLDDADFEQAIKSLKVGEPIYDASIVSTSSDPKVAEKFTGGQGIIFEIDAPAGSPALETPWFYNDLSVLEDEYMLPRNSEFEITEIGDVENGIVRVKVKYRPPLTRQAQGIQTPQLNKPKFDNINVDTPTFGKDGSISVPNSPEAKALDALGGGFASEDQLKQVDDKARGQFTSDPNFKPFDPSLATKAQIDSLKDLTPTGESAFTYVDSSLKTNKLLRNRDAATEVSKDVENLDKAILISEHLPPGATVYRMMKLKRWEGLNLEPGQVLFDRGFMSTTMTRDYVDEILDENKAAKNVLQVPMKIIMPNNTSGISLRPVSWFTNENEYLLPRNTALRFLGWSSSGEAVFERVT